ncbi:organic anion transporter polypeptide (OATP) family domain-containing protein [Ditylenchus destructor]|uniref:Solute carrier organic anion transporter family member n=1 Tax=Ditylenchus destructor TaxID=166010 RepID=A0AAD4N9K4_9BILA|nr:organic anion transporter polypeptide (OATP) family domain-containing protein [Ditylenchus destructor]
MSPIRDDDLPTANGPNHVPYNHSAAASADTQAGTSSTAPASFTQPQEAGSSVQGTSSSIKSTYNDEEITDEEDPLLCGFGSCTPPWLQVFHTAKWLLFMLGICAFVQSFVVNAIFPVGLSTLEKRFHMTSTQTGIISSWYDFAVLLAVFPVCHWGNTGHKGRWIGIGTVIMGIGSFICALPHYIIEPYQINQGLNQSDFGACSADRDVTPTTCVPRTDHDASYLNKYFLIFLLGQTFHGATPLFSIGTAYIDENVSQKASPVYLAIHAVVTSVGPVIGLFVGGFLLSIYDDFDRVDMNTITITNADPRWMGAWWLGFLGCAVAAILTAFPILMFAKELPEAKKHRMKDVNQVHVASQVDATDDILKGNMKHLPEAVWNILRNPTFVTTIVLGIFESIVINGFAAFMPKILETLLSTTPTIASYLSSLVIFAAAAGVMVGGVVIRQMNLQVGGMLKMIFVCHVVALILITGFLIQCPSREFVGITIGYGHQKLKGSTNPLTSTCNENCHCQDEWNPVCDRTTRQIYYSACFAGCNINNKTAEGDIWDDCSCLSESFYNISTPAPQLDTSAESGKLYGGFCTQDCGWSQWIFLVLLFFSVVASFASGIPSQQIMLRVIPFQQRTLGIGVHWTFLRLLGFIPGGVLFGLMIDTTCLKWQESACGKKQSCLVHDPYRLSWTIMAVAVVCKLVSILATIIGYVTYRPNDLDNALSVQTTDSRGPLSLTVNDDRHLEEKPGIIENHLESRNTANAVKSENGI